VWRRATGVLLAPPLVHGDGVVVVGECTDAALPATGDATVGCWWAVTPDGTELGSGRLAGFEAAVAPFLAARGDSTLTPEDGAHLIWARGDVAVLIDLDTGRATPSPARVPAAIARYKSREFFIALDADGLAGRDRTGAELWRVRTRFARVLGVLPGQTYEAPMVRVINLRGASGPGFVDVIDIDATGSGRGQAGTLVPGVAVTAHAFSAALGGSAIVVSLDATTARTFIAAHDARGTLAWVAPMTNPPALGVAFAADGAVVVHRGDRISVLPPVSRIATP
jgi:hypothetical protein